MFRLYFGLLLVGLTAAAHASEATGGDVLISQPDQPATRFAGSGTDVLSPCKPSGNSVVLKRAAIVAPTDVALGGSGFGTASGLSPVSQPKKETAAATPARWGENVGGNQILSLVRHKRVEFTGEQYKVTLRQDSALIEAGHLKVALRSGSTSMLWSKAL